MAILYRTILKTIFSSAERCPSPMTGAILKQSEPNYQLFTGTASVFQALFYLAEQDVWTNLPSSTKIAERFLDAAV
jgi:hypothetical protein